MQNNNDIDPIVIQDLWFKYPDKEVLQGCSFTVSYGHTTFLMGDNGAGKSTAIKLILGELKPTGGTIKLFGQQPSCFKSWEKLGYVPQFEAQGVQGFPATALEIVRSGYKKEYFQTKHTWFEYKAFKQERDSACLKALAMCGVEELSTRMISALSGGQRQRVMLARALVGKPELLVLDEPTSSLDAAASRQFFALLENLCHKQHLAALVVTHDQAQLSCSYAQVVTLKDGVCSVHMQDRR